MSHKGLPIHEQFQTPQEVVDYMVNMVPPGVKTVLEPYRGKGTIVRSLTYRQYQVTAPVDFFLLKPRQFDCVVMNPPFSDTSCNLINAPEDVSCKGMRAGYYFLLQCMEMSDTVIALMPWFTILDSDVRSRHLKSFGMKSLTALPRRTFNYARSRHV